MDFPKWKYRKHPELGFFQSTLVAHAEAETELGDTWSDDPNATGFAVRPASQIHTSHIASNVLHEVITDAAGQPVEAEIDVTVANHKMGV